MRSRSSSDATSIRSLEAGTKPTSNMSEHMASTLGQGSSPTSVASTPTSTRRREKTRRTSLPSRSLSMNVGMMRAMVEHERYFRDKRDLHSRRTLGIMRDRLRFWCTPVHRLFLLLAWALRLAGRYTSWRKKPRVFAGLIVYLLLLMAVASNLRHSLFFSPDLKEVIANENALTAWSKPTLMSLGFNVDSLDETADELAAPRICIVMTTAERKIPYSYAAAATVLRSLIESKEDGAFIVNDVGFYKDRKRPGVDLLELSGVQVVRRRGCDYSKRGASRCSRHVKAKLDYIQSLKACLDTTSARYVTVIDDDVVVSKRFVQRQLLAADALQENAMPWTLLRLFRTDAYDNFSLASPTSLLELVLFSAANSFLWIFILGKPFWTVQTWSAELRHLFISRAFTFFSLSALSLLVFGRQNTFAPFGIHSGVFKSPSEAGSVGIMYPRQIADALVDFLQNGKGPSAVDEAINDFCGQYHKNAPCLVLRPNLMEHVGRFSSLSSRRTILENTRLQLHFASGMRTSEWFISDDTSLQDKFEARRAKATESLDSPLFVSALDNVNQILADTGGLTRRPLIFIISSIALINIVGFGEHFFIPVSRKHMRNILRAMRPPRPPMRSV